MFSHNTIDVGRALLLDAIGFCLTVASWGIKFNPGSYAYNADCKKHDISHTWAHARMKTHAASNDANS